MQSSFRFELDGHADSLDGADRCDYDLLGNSCSAEKVHCDSTP